MAMVIRAELFQPGLQFVQPDFFNQLTTGAADDFKKATQLARSMVTEWGMSDRIGPMAWGSSGQVFLGEDFMSQRESVSMRSRRPLRWWLTGYAVVCYE